MTHSKKSITGQYFKHSSRCNVNGDPQLLAGNLHRKDISLYGWSQVFLQASSSSPMNIQTSSSSPISSQLPLLASSSSSPPSTSSSSEGVPDPEPERSSPSLKKCYQAV